MTRFRVAALLLLLSVSLGLEVVRGLRAGPAAPPLAAGLATRGFRLVADEPVSVGGTVRVQRYLAAGCAHGFAVAALDPSGDTLALLRHALGGEVAVVRAGTGWPLAPAVAVAPAPGADPDLCALSTAEWAQLLR